MKHIVVSLGILLFSLHATAQEPPKHKVVFHLSSSDTLVWKGLMNNLKNMKTGWKNTVQIEVVTHGPGVSMMRLSRSTQKYKIADFMQEGVVFVVCENTLRERNIPKTDILPNAQFVPMGVGELVLKQEEGWSYIKAGF